MPMVRIRNLHFGYSRRILQLENLSLDLAKGRIYGLLGKTARANRRCLKTLWG